MIMGRKKLGRFNAKATPINPMPCMIWLANTKNFLVLYISKNAANSGFIVYAKPSALA
ncbi:hypothetical protein D3C84_1299130 [compost metagenome]